MALTVLVFLPAVVAGIILLIPKAYESLARWVALAGSLIVLAISVGIFFALDLSDGGFQFVVQRDWVSIGTFDLQYHLGVDGISMPIVMLTTVLGVAVVLVSFNIRERPRAYFACVLVLLTALLGVFCALDTMLFFAFWEVELFPMFLLIAVWGSGRREYAATKFVIYTFTGSAFMLVGILVLAFNANSFDMTVLQQTTFHGTALPLRWVFLFLFIGFAVHLPVVPFHTWVPDAYSSAPTAVSALLAGAFEVMGGYGMIRLCVSILPDAAHDYAIWFAALGAGGLLYAAFITFRQTDIKKLVAYLSVSQMGLVLLGISALGSTGIIGATYQLVAHGVITALLFIMVGLIVERSGTKEISRFGGLARQMPLLALGLGFAGFASLGLPSLAGFIAEFTVFLGSFQQYEWAVLMAIFGAVLSAGYILWMLERVIFGPIRPDLDGLPDQHHWWEHSAVAGLAAVIILLGVYPSLLTDMIGPAVSTIVTRVGS